MVEEKEKKAPLIHWDRSQEKTLMELCLEIASTAEWDKTTKEFKKAIVI
jgi:hypothetical protein